jgi:hypothetical protein
LIGLKSLPINESPSTPRSKPSSTVILCRHHPGKRTAQSAPLSAAAASKNIKGTYTAPSARVKWAVCRRRQSRGLRFFAAARLKAAGPAHPSLRFKKVHATLPINSMRVDLDWRAVGILQEDTVIWFWIGSRADYEKRLRDL